MTDSYFAGLEKALKEAGCFRPTLVIDRDRLDRNLERLKSRLAPQLMPRVVDKSLPSLPLINHVMQTLATHRIMSFHLGITVPVLAAFPQAEILFGKPMPTEAVELEFARADGPMREALSRRVVWLVDTPERLESLSALARKIGTVLRIAFEVDVGLHRGGLGSPAALAAVAARARTEPFVKIEGLMAYEVHIPQVPFFAGGPKGEKARVSSRFRAFLDCLGPTERQILNTGGSLTLLTYGTDYPANDVSVGSALVLPTAFESPALEGFEPAAFIATPALKVVPTRLPGSDLATRLFRMLGKITKRNCYIYGGAWMAVPVYPPGLSESRIWWRSSNQQFYTMADETLMSPGDLVFLRPTQSEAVLQQFGPLAIYSGGRIIDRWAQLPTG